MDTPDAATIAQQALSMGLVTEDQLVQAWGDLGTKGGPAEPLVQFLERKGYLTNWQSQKLLKGDPDGYYLGGYRILYRIASGSFGRVYRAEDPRSGRMVAIKVLRRKWSEDQHGVDLFVREGKVGMSLRHPNVVEVLAVSQDASTGQYFIVMEFVEGGNLRELLKSRKKLGPPEVLRILEDAANGLAHSFSKGISHRDMKLTNILLSTSQGVAKLVDFGLAGMEEIVHKEGGGQVDRTLDYAGLERATRVPPGDIRSDIYFLGCVAYELLTGRPPLVSTRDKRQRMLKDRFVAAESLAMQGPALPAPVVRLVETMMALEPLRRFQTPAQMLEAIREARKGLEEAADARSVFILERDERLQDVFRQKFKEKGFRVFLAIDPARALDRFRRQPYQVLISDVGTVGEEGIYVSERILVESDRLGVALVVVLLLAEDQKAWADKIRSHPSLGVLVQPVTLKDLQTKVRELLAARGLEYDKKTKNKGDKETGGPGAKAAD
jgi:serine/threonine protein kinase